jgi:DNA replication protein DnaC
VQFVGILPGVGKSHALAAIGNELVLLGHPVLWTPTATLVQELLAAKRDLRLPHALAKLDRFDCVFLDDIGCAPRGAVIPRGSRGPPPAAAAVGRS